MSEADDIRFLLDGLSVEGVAELKRLVDLGRREEARLGRKADVAAAVAAIPDPRERLLAALDLGVDRGRAENGLFVHVTLDEGRPSTVAGVWLAEADAFLALAEEDLRDTEHGQVLERTILPLFLDNVPERE